MNAPGQYRAVWNAALTQRSRAAFTAAKYSSFVLQVCGLFAGIVLHEWRAAANMVFTIPAAIFLLVWVCTLVPGAALMNTPANAKLVPNMRRRLVEMTAAGWVCVWLLGLSFPVWQAANLIALWVIGMSTARSGGKVGSFVVIAAGFWPMMSKRVPPAVLQFLLSDLGFACATAATAAFGAYAITRALPNGGERHCRQRHAQADSIAQLEGRQQGRQIRIRARGLYAFVLRRACAGKRRSLVLHVFGPGGHWASAANAFALLAGLGIAVRVLLDLSASARTQETLAHIGWPFLATLLFAHLAVMDFMRGRIAATTGEQKLFRLAAASPAADRFNRQFAVELLANAALSWLFVTCLILTLAVASGAPAGAVVTLAALCSMFCLPSLASVLQDYATQDQTSPVLRFVTWLLLIGLAGGGAVVVHLAAVPAWTMITIALAVNAAGAAVMQRRFRSMAAAPVAFPARRLG